LYEEDTEICLGRNYQAITYESEAAAEAAGAVITHKSGEFDGRIDTFCSSRF
jgi:hypothetical protein